MLKGTFLYWRHDHHYASKVQRQDVVFLAGLSAKLVHDVVQVLFYELYWFLLGMPLHLRADARY